MASQHFVTRTRESKSALSSTTRESLRRCMSHWGKSELGKNINLKLSILDSNDILCHLKNDDQKCVQETWTPKKTGHKCHYTSMSFKFWVHFESSISKASLFCESVSEWRSTASPLDFVKIHCLESPFLIRPNFLVMEKREQSETAIGRQIDIANLLQRKPWADLTNEWPTLVGGVSKTLSDPSEVPSNGLPSSQERNKSETELKDS